MLSVHADQPGDLTLQPGSVLLPLEGVHVIALSQRPDP